MKHDDLMQLASDRCELDGGPADACRPATTPPLDAPISHVYAELMPERTGCAKGQS